MIKNFHYFNDNQLKTHIVSKVKWKIQVISEINFFLAKWLILIQMIFIKYGYLNEFKICFPFIGDSVGGSYIRFLLIKELKIKGNKVKVLIHEKSILSKYLKKKLILKF